MAPEKEKACPPRREVEPGTYQVTEAVPDDWELTSVTCDDKDSSGDKGSGTATFIVDPGEQVTCTFANTHDDVADPPGTLVVAQETAPPGDPTVFTYTGDVAGQICDGERIVQGGLKAGTYTARFVERFLNTDSRELARAIDALGDISHLRVDGFYQSVWQHIFFAEPGDLLLVLHVADVDRRVAKQARHTRTNLVVLHHVDAVGSGFAQHAANVVGHAPAVGDTEQKDPLAGQLQEIHEHDSPGGSSAYRLHKAATAGRGSMATAR